MVFELNVNRVGLGNFPLAVLSTNFFVTSEAVLVGTVVQAFATNAQCMTIGRELFRKQSAKIFNPAIM